MILSRNCKRRREDQMEHSAVLWLYPRKLMNPLSFPAKPATRHTFPFSLRATWFPRKIPWKCSCSLPVYEKPVIAISSHLFAYSLWGMIP
ncbi:hypothetical protein ACLOJK_013882 [Asimina triloba]